MDSRPEPDFSHHSLSDKVLNAIFLILYTNDQQAIGLTVKQICDVLITQHPEMDKLSTKTSNLVSAKLNAYIKKIEKGEVGLIYEMTREWKDASPKRMVYCYKGMLGDKYDEKVKNKALKENELKDKKKNKKNLRSRSRSRSRSHSLIHSDDDEEEDEEEDDDDDDDGYISAKEGPTINTSSIHSFISPRNSRISTNPRFEYKPRYEISRSNSPLSSLTSASDYEDFDEFDALDNDSDTSICDEDDNSSSSIDNKKRQNEINLIAPKSSNKKQRLSSHDFNVQSKEIQRQIQLQKQKQKQIHEKEQYQLQRQKQKQYQYQLQLQSQSQKRSQQQQQKQESMMKNKNLSTRQLQQIHLQTQQRQTQQALSLLIGPLTIDSNMLKSGLNDINSFSEQWLEDVRNGFLNQDIECPEDVSFDEIGGLFD